MYCAKIKPGGMFKLDNGMEGIHLSSTKSASTVIVTYCPHAKTEEDKRYYLGIQRWSPNTEVKEIK